MTSDDLTVTPSEIAQLSGRTARQEQNRAVDGVYGEVDRRDGRIRVPVAGLPVELRGAFYAAHPHLIPKSELIPDNVVFPFGATPPARSYKSARLDAQRRRADLKHAAVIAYKLFLAEWGERPGIKAAKQRWVVGYKATRPQLPKLSVRSIERWCAQYDAAEHSGRDGIDGLVDGNSGTRLGKTLIPRPALKFFRERLLDKTAPPSIHRAIKETRLMAPRFGWKLPKSNDPFYDWTRNHVPDAMKLARRTAVDEPSKVMPYIERAMDVPYRTVQCDHHVADVFVNCEGAICESRETCRAHRPWLTPIMDTGSRKIISYQISLEVPNFERILEAFRLAIEAEGLPQRFYCDNGKDFKKATGWKGLSESDISQLGRCFDTLTVERVFAIVRNAQAKSIERWFGTLCAQRWRGTEGYVGQLGKRSAHTKYLCAHPELLQPFSEFCLVLDAQITIYNNTSHRGTGMKGRTPAQAFAAERIPMRRPHEFAFQLVFWRVEERTFQRNGVEIDYRKYWAIDPDGLVTRDYLGQRVKVLVNPRDISNAVLCTLEGSYICEAWIPELAPHDSRDAITQAANERVGERRKAVRRLYNERDEEGVALLQYFKAHEAEILVEEATRLREGEQQLAAAVGSGLSSSVMLPKYSKLALDRDAMLEQLAAGPRLTPEQRKLAASADDHTDDFLAALRLEELPSEAHDEDIVDPLRFALERERIRKVREGECELECPAPAKPGSRRCTAHSPEVSE